MIACGGDAKQTGGNDAQTGEYGTLSGGPPGGVLVVLADREPDQLNPLTFNTTPAYQAVHLMFRALARRDSTLSGYTPDLARSWEMENDSVLVIHLRDDVLWDDGVKVSAEDVVFSINMQKDPATASPRKGDAAAVKNAVARDSFTVAATLERNSLYTINALLEVVPVPKHLLGDVSAVDMRNAPFGRKPVGNGFYRFVSWNAGQNLTLAVNPQKPDGRASIDRIIMRFIPDINGAMTELLSGQGDLVPKLPPNQKDRVTSSQNVKLYNGPRVRPAWLAWNTRKAPMNDVRIRRALLMAINREEIARALFGDAGEPATSPIPTALREHTPTVKPIPYDPARARTLLDEAGWKDTNGDGIRDRGGKPLRIEVDFISSDQTRQDVLVAVQSMLRTIGVDLAPRAYESTAWVTRLRDGSFAGSFWGWGWGPGVVGPNAEMVFHSRSVPPNGPNFAASGGPRIDALIDSALVVSDTTAARTIWAELEQLLIDDAVYSPIYLDPELFAVHARFRNVKFRGIEWNEDVPFWYIEPGDLLPRDRTR
jgi:peptide/nickel transport system substrate-binding protein